MIDDAVYIVENPAVSAGAPLRAYFLDPATTSSRVDFRTQSWRPLRTLAYRGLARAFGVRAAPFGLANLFLYAMNAALVSLLLRRWLSDERAALGASLLWAIAPVHVEPALYASSLGDHLSLGLELGAITCGLTAAARAQARGRWAAASLGLAGLALLGKEMAVTTGPLLGIGYLLERRPRARFTLAMCGAHLGLALLYLLARTRVLGQLGHAALDGDALVSGLRDAPILLWDYLRVSLMPLGHHPGYVLPPPGAARVVASVLGLGAVLLCSPRLPREITLGLAWFVVALSPVLHLVPLAADLADRFALLPSVGLALAAGGTLALALARGGRAARLAWITVALIGVMYASSSLLQGRLWASDATIWTNSVAEEPASAQAQANLGVVELQAGRPAAALGAFDRAIALGRASGDVHLRRGMALDALGRFREAELAVRRALSLDATLGRGQALLTDLARRRGDLPEARRALERARRAAPDHPSTALAEAALAQAEGRVEEAARRYQELADRFPTEARFSYLAAQAWLNAAQPQRAARSIANCLRLVPDQAQCAALRSRLEGTAR